MRSRKFFVPMAPVLAAALLVNFAAQAREIPKPVPEEKAQKEALALIKELHAADYKKAEGDAEAAVALARKLRGQAAETNDDPAGRYVLNQEALCIFAQQGLIDELERLLHAQDDYFEIDLVATAEALLKDAVRAAEKAKKDDLKKRIELRLADWRARRSAYQAAQAAYLKLKEKPEDPEASRVLGLYRCLDEEKWDEGLTLLKRSSNESEKQLAETDLAAQGDPGQQVAAGDRWWAYAEELGANAKRRAIAEDRSAYWYRKAKPSLAGLTKAKVEKRLADYKKVLDARVAPTEPGAEPDLKPAAHWTFDCDTGDTAADQGSTMLTLRLKGPIAWSEGRILGGLRLLPGGFGEVEDAPALNPSGGGLTVAVWVKAEYWIADGAKAQWRILRKSDKNSAQYELWGGGQKDSAFLVWDMTTVGKIIAPVPSAKEWHHIAVTWDRTEMALFVDGEEIERKRADGPMVPEKGGPLKIGGAVPEATREYYWPGDLDDVRIYNRGLSASEVKLLSKIQFPFPTSISKLKRCIALGEKINHNLLAPGVQGKVAIQEGPDGLKLGADANVTWTPGEGDLGDHVVRVKYTLGDRTFSCSMPVFVMPKALLDKLGTHAEEVVNAGPCALQGAKLLLVNPQWLSWDDAARWAKDRGGMLACIHSAQENKTVCDLAKRINTSKETINLGGNDKVNQGNWMWPDGKPLSFTNWAQGEPNGYNGREDTIAMWIQRGDWNDSKSEGERPFAAEWSYGEK